MTGARHGRFNLAGLELVSSAPAAQPELRAGDRVELASGSPQLTVVYVKGGMAWVHSDDGFHQLPVATLRRQP